MDSELSPLPSCARIDNSFGPWAGECRGGFDFTLLFEETIMTIGPLAILLIFVPFRVSYLFKKSPKASSGVSLPLKLTLWLVYSALQLALIILWTRPGAVRTRASIAVAILNLVAGVAFCLLSYAEHVRTVRPSYLFNIYLFFTVFFDAVRARTLWLQPYNDVIAVVFTVSVAVKAAILVSEALSKRRLLHGEYKEYPSEALVSLYNRSTFWWLNSLFFSGFKKLLRLEDLFKLDKHLYSAFLERLIGSKYEKASKSDKKSPHSLFFSTLSALKWPLLAVVPPRLALIGFNFCQPFLLNRAITLASEPVNERTNQYGYGLIGAYVIVYIGIGISTGQHQHLTFRAITMMRGGLVSMLYRKTGELNIKSVDPAASLTLMSADVERITTGWQFMHEIWANILEIAIAIYLLERQLGAACAVPIAVAIVSMAGSIAATSFIMSRQAMWLEAIEKRITATTQMLGAMKGVKMGGLTDIIGTIVQGLRVSELEISKKFRKLLIWNMAFAYISPVFAPIVTFAVFSAIAAAKDNGTTLDTARVFTSLSLFALLTDPLGSLIMSIANFMGGVGSFARIQEFLDTETRKDNRKVSNALLLNEKAIAESDSSGESVVSVDEKFTFSKGDGDLGGNAITIEAGTFAWDEEKEPVLKDLNVSIPEGKFTMIVGPVGCGKSTLLKAFLGELSPLEGKVSVSSLSIAYCDQSAWHMNGTVRQSILGISEFDEKLYTAVVNACALDEDLRQLPRGDQTLIGSKGIALSGGQSQRIALARAIYAHKDIIILDDVLSGLDNDTENRVFHSLLGRAGLLRNRQATVVVTSSASKRLPYADHVIALSEEGKVAEQGSFEELNITGGYVASFSHGAPDWTYFAEEKPRRLGDWSNKEELAVPKVLTDNETLDAEASRATGDSAIYLYYVNSVGWWPTMIFVVAITCFVVCMSFPTIWVKWWAAYNAENPNGRLDYYLGIYVMLGVLSIIFLIVSCWQMIITMVPKSGENFHWKLLNTVLRAPMSFFANTDTGVTINRFSQDLQLIDMELPIAALNTFATFVLCIAQMALIGVASKYAAISFPIVIAALYFIQRFYLRTSRQLRFMDIEAKAPLYSKFVECLSGLATIRAFGWQRELANRNREALDWSQRPFYLLFAVQRWLTLVLDLVVASIAVLLIVLVVALRGTSMEAGYVGVGLFNVILFSQSIKTLVQFWTQLETHIGAIARIKIFTAQAASEDREEENHTPPPSWPENGAVEFKSLTAAYKADEPVVKDISLSIAPGEKVGIVGRTGSGKSSLIAALFRMIDITGGSIVIDGQDLSRLPRQEIRSRIIGLPQDPYLLTGSIRLNADPTLTASDSAIISSFKSVRLWKQIKNAGGLDADISTLHLTPGQTQLFVLARAMLRKSTILVLDEATSNLDGKTDALMQRAIREKFTTHTIIAVAHKLETILDFDKIAVLDAGELVEFDSPVNLLLREDSAFAKLYRSSVGEPFIALASTGTMTTSTALGSKDDSDGSLGSSSRSSSGSKLDIKGKGKALESAAELSGGSSSSVTQVGSVRDSKGVIEL